MIAKITVKLDRSLRLFMVRSSYLLATWPVLIMFKLRLDMAIAESLLKAEQKKLNTKNE